MRRLWKRDKARKVTKVIKLVKDYDYHKYSYMKNYNEYKIDINVRIMKKTF